MTLNLDYSPTYDATINAFQANLLAHQQQLIAYDAAPTEEAAINLILNAADGVGGGSTSEVLMRLRYVETPTPFTYADCNVQKAAGTPLYLANYGFGPLTGLCDTYLAAGVTTDGDNTGGYKFTPTTSGIITLNVEFVGYGQTLASAVQVLTKVDIAGPNWTSPTSAKSGGGISSGSYGGYAGAWTFDIDDWDTGAHIALLPSLTATPNEAFGLRAFEWYATWTPTTIAPLT